MTVTTLPTTRTRRRLPAPAGFTAVLAVTARRALRSMLTTVASLSVLLLAAGAIALTIAAVGATVTQVTW